MITHTYLIFKTKKKRKIKSVKANIFRLNMYICAYYFFFLFDIGHFWCMRTCDSTKTADCAKSTVAINGCLLPPFIYLCIDTSHPYTTNFIHIKTTPIFMST